MDTKLAPPMVCNRQMTEGYFKGKIVKDGPMIPIRAWYSDGLPNQDGNATEDEGWRVTIDGKQQDPYNLNEAWLFWTEISEEEFIYMTADSQHAKAYREDDPKATPDRTVAGVGHNEPPKDANVFQDLADLAAECGDFCVVIESHGAGLLTIDDARKAVMFAKRLKIIQGRMDEEFKAESASLKQALDAMVAPYKRGIDGAEDIRQTFLTDLQDYMDRTKTSEVKTDYGPKAYIKMSLQAKIDDEKAIPKKFRKVDEKAVLKALKDDKQVKGASLAHKRQVIVS